VGTFSQTEDTIMIKKLLAVTIVTALGTWASTVAAAPGHSASTQCYVWANNAAPVIGTPYTPSTMYSFNASGDAASYNMINRTGTGTYAVTCKGVGGAGWASAGGHVQVTAYGGTDSYCKVQNWSSSGTDFTANVKCYSSAGAAVNSQFDLSFVW
jgi:hypothetical protein